MKNQPHGVAIVTVDTQNSELPFKVLLKSSGVKKQRELPYLWFESHTKYVKIPLSKEAPILLRKWIATNYDVLIKHWNLHLCEKIWT